MALREVRDRLTVFLGREANDLRTCYIERFVDTSSDHYRRDIATLVQCSDGMCYRGYLWDCLRKPWQRVTEHFIIECLRAKSELAYVLWDIHSRGRIFIPDYWKFPKEAVLQG